MNDVIEDRIQSLVDSLPPHGAGSITDHRLRFALEQIAQVAYAEGKTDALRSLRTSEDAAATWGVSRARAHQRIQRLHQQHAVGAKMAGVWLLTQEEIDQFAPVAPGRPRKETQNG